MAETCSCEIQREAEASICWFQDLSEDVNVLGGFHVFQFRASTEDPDAGIPDVPSIVASMAEHSQRSGCRQWAEVDGRQWAVPPAAHTQGDQRTSAEGEPLTSRLRRLVESTIEKSNLSGPIA